MLHCVQKKVTTHKEDQLISQFYDSRDNDSMLTQNHQLNGHTTTFYEVNA